MPTLGKVYLIGAGPGAQDLMTLRGARPVSYTHLTLPTIYSV